jgi:cytochrome c oxidase accessory protein FixG
LNNTLPLGGILIVMRHLPKPVSGKFRDIKTILSWLLVGFFIFAPWINYHRAGDVSSQFALFSVEERRGYFAGLELWTHDLYIIALFLFASATLLFFSNSVAGRLWCGYACPQTIWSDIYSKIALITLGKKYYRHKYKSAPFWRQLLMHILWLLVAVITATAFFTWFMESEEFIARFIAVELELASYILWLAIAMLTYLLAGFAREKVCTHMCPWPRFQFAMLDDATKSVMYDEKRGEPRGFSKHNPKQHGDCVDCNQCVEVCPTNIDIRQGLDLGCINCGLCVDACNNIMSKVNKPLNLIGYHNNSTLTGGKSKFAIKTYLYGFVSLASIVALALLVIYRPLLHINIINTDQNKVMLKDGSIRKTIIAHITNKSTADISFKISSENLVIQPNIIHLAKRSSNKVKMFIIKPDHNSAGFITVDY